MVNEFNIDILEKTGLENKLIKCKKQLDKIFKEKKTIVLFGAGTVGVENLRIIKKLSKIKIVFCDNDSKKQGTTIEGIIVINFNELITNYKDNYIIITSISYYDEILNQLKEFGLEKNLINAFDNLLVNSEYKSYYNLIKENESKFSEIYSLFSDEYSKELFINRLNYCITGNPQYLIPLKSKKQQYFEHKVISLKEDEIFIDGGGYTGDTVEEFLKQTNKKFNKIYSFEPEKSKHKEFINKFSNFKNIELVPYGLWNKKDILHFNSDDSGASCVSDTGDIEISVISIDEFLNGEKVTFIKMDIEGAELEALQGAKNTIQRFLPKLAICIYHKPLDIIEIPSYIKKIAPKYKLYLRHYSNFHSETVLYAVAE
jgi:FkbM family methyltransferase